MKRMMFVLMLVILFCGSAFGATLNLRATWTANTESDMASYKLYRTDTTRTLIGTIAHPTTTYNFSITVPDGSTGTLTFVLTAVDTNNNESVDSNTASYSYNLDSTPPGGPRNLSVQKQ
jgi:fibronectin type 3 domain-containing protein